LANRLKFVIPHLVGKKQTAFVKGRRIGDNILLAQELLRNFIGIEARQGVPSRWT